VPSDLFSRVSIHRLAAIPLHYSLRNLWVRRITTILTAGGMALVVFVFATSLMLDAGLKRTLVATGEPDNVVVSRKGSSTELQSAVDRSQAALVAAMPEVAVIGEALASREVVMLISLPKKGSGKISNATIRGMEQTGVTLRRKVRLIEGRMFRPGSNEIVVGRSILAQFSGVERGQSLTFGGRDWLVVGVMDGARSGFDSEIWGDVDSLMQSFRRNAYSSIVVRLVDPERGMEAVVHRFNDDPRITLAAKRETDYYAEQSAALSRFIRILGLTLAGVFSIGAIIGATITMQSAVASRTAEIGTLRALGFQRHAILLAFMAESIGLALIGGVAGVALAASMELVEFSTTNFQSFAELAFGFELSPGIVAASLLFSVGMGLAGGMLPAIRAARIGIVEALRCG
jgi:putative ABC transport system permease protein